MLAMLGSVLVVVVLAVAASALLVACSAVPFVKAVDLAERRGFSAGRWGTVQVVLLVLGALVGYLALRHSLVLLLPALALCWAPPLVLSLLGADDRAVGGYQGRHEA